MLFSRLSHGVNFGRADNARCFHGLFYCVVGAFYSFRPESSLNSGRRHNTKPVGQRGFIHPARSRKSGPPSLDHLAIALKQNCFCMGRGRLALSWTRRVTPQKKSPASWGGAQSSTREGSGVECHRGSYVSGLDDARMTRCSKKLRPDWADKCQTIRRPRPQMALDAPSAGVNRAELRA
jgi:hypothetical protein